MVLVVGLEPTRYCYQRSLNPPGLPIPPHQHIHRAHFVWLYQLKVDPMMVAVRALIGVDDETRTRNRQLGRLELHQLSYIYK